MGRGARRAGTARGWVLDRRWSYGYRRGWSPSRHPPSPPSLAKAACRPPMRRGRARGLPVAGRSSRTSTWRAGVTHELSALHAASVQGRSGRRGRAGTATRTVGRRGRPARRQERIADTAHTGVATQAHARRAADPAHRRGVLRRVRQLSWSPPRSACVEDQHDEHRGGDKKRDDDVDRRPRRLPGHHDTADVICHVMRPFGRRAVASCGGPALRVRGSRR